MSDSIPTAKRCYPTITIKQLTDNINTSIALVEALQQHLVDMNTTAGHSGFELLKADLFNAAQTLEGGDHV